MEGRIDRRKAYSMIKNAATLQEFQNKSNIARVTETSGEKWGKSLLIIILILGLIVLFLGFKVFLTLSVGLGFLAIIVGLQNPSLGVFGLGLLCALDAPMRVFLSSGILSWNTFNFYLLFVMLLFL